MGQDGGQFATLADKILTEIAAQCMRRERSDGMFGIGKSFARSYIGLPSQPARLRRAKEGI
jgi:hypothetical protein